ncbi:uracil-DNA glycosylase [Gordonia phosphorivorans]|uniref:Uracil-DNA glycosylase n=1 Tax=Gordonia phosphorivorans TaxID=1056982 RepID=A0ABV6H8B4_9ACTN
MSGAIFITVPGGRPRAVYHVTVTCEVFAADLDLARLADPEATALGVSRHWARSHGIPCACCLPELAETLHAHELAKDCVVLDESGERPAALMHWRKDTERRWWGLVVFPTEPPTWEVLPADSLRVASTPESETEAAESAPIPAAAYPQPVAKRGGDPAHQALLIAGRDDPHVAPINEYVDNLVELTGEWQPYVAPTYGGVNARLLSLFQDPGPKTRVQQGTGMLSVENPDDSAARYLDLLERHGIDVADTQSWNSYPWYLGTTPHGPTDEQLRRGTSALADLRRLLPQLHVVLLHGKAARKAWALLAAANPDLVEGITTIETYHTSLRVVEGKSPAERARREARLDADFARAASVLLAAEPASPVQEAPPEADSGPSREIAVPEPDEVVVSAHDEGLLVYGDPRMVEQYLAQLSRATRDAVATPIKPKDLASVMANVAAGANIAAHRGSFVRLSPDSLKLLRAHGVVPGTGGYNRMFVHGGGGKIAGQLQWKTMPVGPSQAMAVQMFAMQMALKTAIASVEDAVKQVQNTVNQILRLVQADRVGDVVGHHRTLKRAVTDFEQYGVLLKADWDAVASLGPSLEQVVAKLHDHLRKTVRTFDANLQIGDRADSLRSAVSDADFGESLRLLIVTQDAMFLWQVLRIEQVRDTEPEKLDHAIRTARKTLLQHARDDEQLYRQASRNLEAVRKIKPLEAVRFPSTGKLRADTDTLHHDLDLFAQSRRLQVITWTPRTDPGLADAAAEARARVGAAARIPAQVIANRKAQAAGKTPPRKVKPSTPLKKPSSIKKPKKP